MKLKSTQEQLLPTKIIVDELVLSIPSEEEAEQLFKVLNDNREHVGRFLNKPFKLASIGLVKQYIEKNNKEYSSYKTIQYVIKLNKKIIGVIEAQSFCWKHGAVEIGFWIDKNHVGKGYISKCLKKIEELLFKMGFERLFIRTASENIKSQNVAKRNGYIYEGTNRHGYFSVYKQDYVDCMVFSKLKSEWHDSV